MNTDATLTTESKGFIRLEVQVETLRNDVHRLNNLIMSANSPADIKFSQHEKALNSRLESIEQNQKTVVQTIDKLSDKLDARSKFPFAIVFGFVGLLFTLGGGIGGMVLNGVKGDLDRFERDVVAIQAQVVPRIEHKARWDSQDMILSKILSRIEALEARPRR